MRNTKISQNFLLMIKCFEQSWRWPYFLASRYSDGNFILSFFFLLWQSGAKINISDGSCPERIVTVSGSTSAIYKAFTLITKKFEEVSLWKSEGWKKSIDPFDPIAILPGYFEDKLFFCNLKRKKSVEIWVGTEPRQSHKEFCESKSVPTSFLDVSLNSIETVFLFFVQQLIQASFNKEIKKLKMLKIW